MAEFAYSAINAQGLELSGTISAPDVGTAREQLQARGLLPNALSERAAAGEGGVGSAFKKVKPKSLQVFSRQLAAMIYPAVVLSFASLVLTFMLLFIVPVFQTVFDSLGGQLPTPTKIVIAMSNALRDWWFVIFPMIGFGIYGLRRLKRTEQGRQKW